jgi:hypothetical protein
VREIGAVAVDDGGDLAEDIALRAAPAGFRAVRPIVVEVGVFRHGVTHEPLQPLRMPGSTRALIA